MADENERWIPAAQVLRDVTGRIAAGLGIDKNDAWQEAAHAILERLAAGTLLAAPKGFLLQYDGPERPHRYWFELRQVEADGRETPHPPVMEPDWDECCIPSDFWRAFKRADAAARADWASGDFYISEFEDTAGNWSGVARDVQFNRDGLPGAGLPLIHHPNPAGSDSQRFDLPKNKGGARPQYDWPRAIAHLVALANDPDGLDPTGKGQETNVSHVARLMEEWFDTQGVGRPGNSQLRKFAGIVVGAINDLKAAKSATTE